MNKQITYKMQKKWTISSKMS